MPSPFPGMNPYLEDVDVWHDFHESFLPHVREVLTPQLPPHYVTKLDEHLFIHEPPAEQRVLLGRGDIFLATPKPAPATGGVASAPQQAPAQVVLPTVDFERLSYLEIRDRRDRTVVTVIELLSPPDKYSGPDRDLYLAKRLQVLLRRTNLVEIDLLRGGPRLPFAVPPPPCDYYALVSRVEDWPRGEFWPIQLRDRLPVIPIPLREPDPDAHLDLQAVLHHVYDAARYGNYIYDGKPTPALSPEDEAWAQQFVPPPAR